ncbi:MAG: hypothetical protein ACKO04_05800 [Actinomycetes bacterium]
MTTGRPSDDEPASTEGAPVSTKQLSTKTAPRPLVRPMVRALHRPMRSPQR